MSKREARIYLVEFETMSYRKRFYYLWNNELSVTFPRINKNPLKWCLMDLLKLLYVPMLYLVFVPLLACLCANEARLLKTRYKDCEDKKCTFIDGWMK